MRIRIDQPVISLYTFQNDQSDFYGHSFFSNQNVFIYMGNNSVWKIVGISNASIVQINSFKYTRVTVLLFVMVKTFLAKQYCFVLLLIDLDM